MPAKTPYAELCEAHRAAALLSSTSALLEWDQETYMPPKGAEFRAEQLAELARLAHERRTSPKLGELIARCEGDAALSKSDAGANLREMRRDYDRATRLPGDLVAEIALVRSQAMEAWKGAREKSDFKAFAPWLERMVSLQRRKADCLGYAGGEPYDALLEEHEPHTTAADVEAVFTPLRAELAGLIHAVRDSRRTVKTKCLRAKLDPRDQHAFGLAVLKAMGFDLDAGRLDTTVHPFCSGIAPGDTRLTTRYRERGFTDALYGTMHEGGHGLYEQGLPKGETSAGARLFGTPLADAVSLGIHESQSRMWENFVGRSKPFWKWALSKSKKHFAKALSDYDASDYFHAVNTVTPSLIRVEADEGTYNMHIMIRFEIERALLAGSLKVKDVPAEWNRRYKDYLAIDVPDDRQGCLQDVHWSFGLFGYFPTYTLGNLYAAQLWETINAALPDLPKLIAKGDFLPLRDWLRTNIHRHGRRYPAAELCRRATGKPLAADALLRHLRSRAAAVYHIDA